jgi:hypothetical protein
MHCTTCIRNNNALNAPSTKRKCVIKYVETSSTLPTGISASERSQPKSTYVHHWLRTDATAKLKPLLRCNPPRSSAGAAISVLIQIDVNGVGEVPSKLFAFLLC